MIARSSVTSQPVVTSSDTTLAPCPAKSRTVAAPMPRAPPVTMATLPSRRRSSMAAQYTEPAMYDLVFHDALLLEWRRAPAAGGGPAGGGRGSGARAAGGRGRTDRGARRGRRRGARDDRCFRPGADARDHRQPHALRRAAHV